MLRKLLVMTMAVGTLTACVVEEVTVDTGGPDEPVADDDDRTRPDPRDPDAPDEEPVEGPDDLDDDLASEPFVDPAEVLAGDLVLAFVVADGSADMHDAVDVALYGAPDVTVATWAVRDADELAVSLQVSDASPAGTLDVVVELADGGVMRIAEGLTVRR